MKDIETFISRFKAVKLDQQAEDEEAFAELVRKGQQPKMLVIACCDSRVDPAVLTGSALGDMFVIRNVANLVPPYERHMRYAGTQSGLEYAVKVLNVEHIVVLGHSHCGGIQALIGLNPATPELEFVAKWVQIARPAWEGVRRELEDKAPEVQARACEQASLITSLDNLSDYPWIAARVKAGTLHLHAWYFDMRARALYGYNRSSAHFDLLG